MVLLPELCGAWSQLAFKHALGKRCVAHLQRLPGDLDKNVDEILAEVDKDRNGEVDYEEVSCFCTLSKFLHAVRDTLEARCTESNTLVIPMSCSLSHHIPPVMCIALALPAGAAWLSALA